MKRTEQNAFLASLLALALAMAGCSSTGTSEPSSQTSSASSMPSDAASPGSAMPGSAGAASSAAAADQSTGGAMPSASASAPNAVVTLIEVLPRADGGMPGAGAGGAGGAGGASGMGGTSGTSGTAGTSASGTGMTVYRVTVRMDDGSTRILSQETAPGFRVGDRVNASSTMIAPR